MILEAVEADLPEIAKIEQSIFNQPWTLANFKEAFQSQDAKLWVAKQEAGTVDGYLLMYCSIDEGEVMSVAVAPSARKQGLGDALIASAKEHAIVNHLTRIVLEVRISNAPAIALYEKNGFENLGIRKGFYDFPKEDAMIMAWENR